MGLPRIELTTFVGSDDFRGVYHGSGPVEALSKGVSHECLWCGMMSTRPRVDFLEQAPTLLEGDEA